MNQRDRLHNYLKRHGEISWDTALSELQTYRLSARIGELRNKGHKIETVHYSKPHVTRYILRSASNG